MQTETTDTHIALPSATPPRPRYRVSARSPWLWLLLAPGCAALVLSCNRDQSVREQDLAVDASPTPTISSVKIISTTKTPLTISFAIEFKRGADSAKVGRGNPEKIFVGIGAPGQIAKMVDFLIEKKYAGASLGGGGSVTSCSDAAWKENSNAQKNISGRVEFERQELTASRVPVSFVLLDEAGAKSNPIDLEVDFSTKAPEQ